MTTLNLFRSSAFPLPDEPGIFGKVLSDRGNRLSNLQIQIFLSDTNSIQNIGHPGWSNADGEFYIPLSQPGNYKLVFTSPDIYFRSFVDEYYQDAQTLEDAKSIYWDVGQKVKLPEARLTELPVIKGKVTFVDGRLPIFGSVYVWRHVDNEWHSIPSTQESILNLNTGEYQVRLLDMGRYRVQATANLWGYNHNSYEPLSRFYGGENLESAEDIVIGLNEERSEINIVLGEDDFEAKIYGQITNGFGKPLPNIKVELFSFSSFSVPFIFTTTNASGYFTFTDLINGTYYLRYSDPTAEYATVYHLGQAGANRAIQITTTGNSPAVIPVTMELAGKIEGNIRTDDGQLLSQALVALFLVDTSLGQINANPANTRTDTNGAFQFHGVLSGTYQLRFTHPSFSQDQSIPYGQFDFETKRYIPSNITVTPTMVSRADMVVIKFDTVYLPIVSK